MDAPDEQAIEEHVNAVVENAGTIDVAFNAIGMDDVQGTLLIEMLPEDFLRPIIKAMTTQFPSPPGPGPGEWWSNNQA